jgi:oligo-alginate lyase
MNKTTQTKNKSPLARLGLIVFVVCCGVAEYTLAEDMQAKPHPALVITAQDVAQMRAEIARDGRFKTEYQKKKSQLDLKLALPKQVPIYTHGCRCIPSVKPIRLFRRGNYFGRT